MAGIDLAFAQKQLDYWLARDAELQLQSYTIDGKQGTKVSAAAITDKIEYWNGWVQRLTPATGNRLRYVVPR